MTLEQISYRYSHEWVLHSVSQVIKNEEFILLQGANGSGKSTLLKIMASLLKPTRGKITGKTRVRWLGHHHQLYEHLSIEENLRFFSQLYKTPVPSIEIEDQLNALSLTSHRKKKIANLSAGQKKKVSLIKMILAPHEAEIFLFDEPLTNLDTHTRDILIQTLRQLHQKGKTLVIASHEIEAFQPLITRKLILQNGELAS